MALVNKYKSGDLTGTIIICRNPMCNKAIDLGYCLVKIFRAPAFDTYVFYCPKCNKILAMDYDFKNGKTIEDIQSPYEDL